MKRALIPAELRAACAAARMSPGIASGNHIFLTGVTGAGADGKMPERDASQFNACFDKIASVLAEADLNLDAIVEMTSYHVGLRGHFDVFDEIRRARFADPCPAWTAVEVAGLRRLGAVVEIRVIADIREQS